MRSIEFDSIQRITLTVTLTVKETEPKVPAIIYEVGTITWLKQKYIAVLLRTAGANIFQGVEIVSPSHR